MAATWINLNLTGWTWGSQNRGPILLPTCPTHRCRLCYSPENIGNGIFMYEAVVFIRFPLGSHSDKALGGGTHWSKCVLLLPDSTVSSQVFTWHVMISACKLPSGFVLFYWTSLELTKMFHISWAGNEAQRKVRHKPEVSKTENQVHWEIAVMSSCQSAVMRKPGEQRKKTRMWAHTHKPVKCSISWMLITVSRHLRFYRC